MSSRLLNSLNIFIMIIGIIILYFLYYPYNPLVFNDLEFPVVNKVIHQGDMLYYHSNYCKYMDLSALVTRTFANNILYLTPSTITNRPMGCNNIVIGVLVPPELPIGSYQIKMRYDFRVNPIRTITILENTEEFEVLEATASAR